MIEQQWIVVFRFIRALFPQQRFDEYTPEAWFEVLGSYDADELRKAIAACATEKPFISPAEIIAAIRRGRADRMNEFEYEPGDPDETGAQYIERRRQQIAAVAAGQRPATLPALPGRAIGELTAVGREIPAEQQPVRRPGPLGIQCPRCHQPTGKPCKTTFRGRRMTDVHPARLDASRSN